MDFALSPEHELIRSTTREFVRKEIDPFVNEWEEKGEIPESVFQKMAAHGFFGAPYPEDYGGTGLDYLGYIVMTEELARGCSSLRTTLSVQTSLCGNTIFHFGSEKQKRAWVVPLAKGDRKGAWALSEHESASDAAAMKTTATKKDATWHITGRKMWISNGDVADYVVVFARTSPWDPKNKYEGITAFLVEKGTPGFTAGAVFTKNKLGLRASRTAELVLEDCAVPDANRLGEVGQGWEIAKRILNYGRLSVAAGAVGIAAAAFDAALDYSKSRTSFGRPIAEFQLIQEKLALMSIDLETSRLLVYKAAWMKMQGQDNRLAVSQAKLHSALAAMRVTEEAVQIYGGAGYTTDAPVERYFRDAKICGIYEGTNEIQKILIARHLTGMREL